MECQKEKNLEKCSCTYPGCPRKGMCCDCIEHHRDKGELPACCFNSNTEKTYDRSIEKFIEDQNSNLV